MGKKKSSDLRSNAEAPVRSENVLETELASDSIAAGNTVADLIRDLLQGAEEDGAEGGWQNLQPVQHRNAQSRGEPLSVEDLLEDDPFLQEFWVEETTDRSSSLQAGTNQQEPVDQLRQSSTQDAIWYLGIDIGTTGISAVLL